MKLKISIIENLTKKTVSLKEAFVSQNDDKLIILSGDYTLTITNEDLKMVHKDAEKTIEALFSPQEPTNLKVNTEYGVTVFDVKTTLYEHRADVIHLKYDLMSQNQLVDSFEFEFELISRKDKN